MVSKLNRSLLAALVIGAAVTGVNAHAEINTVAADYAVAQYPQDSGYDCINNICVGMYVDVTGGEWQGEAGSVTAVDQYSDTITVLSSSGYSLYPRSYDVQAELSQPSSTGCVANICIGDQVRILAGYYAGQIGQVVDADDYNYTATILVGGRYSIEDVRDLTLSVRPTTYPRSYPNYPRNCTYGDYDDIYDSYRGCVRIDYPYPHPYPHPIPYPRPYPRQYPAPRGYPVPPSHYPVPRGPMPGHPYPGGPRGPQGPGYPYPQGPRGPQNPGGVGRGGYPPAPQGPGYPYPQGPRGPQNPGGVGRGGYPSGPQGPGYPSPQGPRGPQNPGGVGRGGYPSGPQAPRGPQGPGPQGPRGPQNPGGVGRGGGMPGGRR
jgi:ribosomal protein L24